MHSLLINIQNKALMDKVLCMLQPFEKDGLGISSIEDFEDWKLARATRGEETIAFTEYLKNEAEYQEIRN
jgi:hypothetical protein